MIDGSVKLEMLNNLEREVHVWFCSPDDFRVEKQLADFKSVLSPEEMNNYHRFKVEKDRLSYLVTHAMLRLSLSEYLDADAAQLSFSVGSHGKPELKIQSNENKVDFNISHTQGLSVCAISVRGAIGIDAEYIKRKNNLERVAQRMFSEQEQCYLKSCDNASQDFFYLWTLREAYAKALGTGLADSANKFYFELDADKKSAVVHSLTSCSDDSNGSIKDWQFSISQPIPDYVTSLAYESVSPVTVKFIEFSHAV